MKMQFDKEALIKHRFWIGLGASAVFALVAFICVLGIRSDAVAKFGEAKKVDDNLKDIPRKGDKLRNEQWIAAMKVETIKSVIQKDTVWDQEFMRQQEVERERAPEAPPAAPGSEPVAPPRGKILQIRNPFIVWPDDVKDLVVHLGKAGMFPTPMSELDFGWKIDIVPTQYKEVYHKQFEDLVKRLPLELLNEKTGAGALRVLGSDASHEKNLLAMLRPHLFTSRPVLSDEAWLLQEDFAIKRDVVAAIAEANQLVGGLQPEWRPVALPEPPKAEADGAAAGATSTPPPPAEKPATPEAGKDSGAETVVDRKRFYNTTWTYGATVPDPKQPADAKPAPKPTLEWWQGWQLDLDLVRKGEDFQLRGTSANLSDELPLPATTLAVFLADAQGKELPNPVLLTDAGGIPPSRNDKRANQFALSKHDLKPLPAPKEARRVLRVQRVAVKPTLDDQVFFNGTWLVHVKLVPSATGTGATLEGRMVNRSRMTLPAAFEVTFSDGKDTFKETFKQAKGDPFKSGEEREFTKVEVRRTTAPKRIVAIRQILDWRSVPVKQINRIEFTDVAHAQSDRTKIRDLKLYDFKRKDPAGAAEAAAAAPAAPADSGGPALGEATSGPGGGKGLGTVGGFGAARNERTENHNVPLRRYYEVTEEVRRVPFALVLVVDAGYMNDVLASLANSRLRIQITQVVWNRLPGGLPKPNFTRPPAPPAGGAGPAGGGTSDGREGPAAPAGSPKSGPPPGYPIPPMGAGAGGSAPAAPRGPVGSEEETSEIEIQIYGLISIYENPDALQKIKEMQAKSAQAATPATPATP